MSQQSLVSVVLATHAGDDLAHLRESIGSVAAQTHRPIELIVVCDGPVSAATDAFLDQTASQHPWVHIRRRAESGGPGAARNTVLVDCTGDYIAVLDADDIMDSGRLAAQVRYLEAENLDLVGSWLAVMDHDGHQIGVRRFPEDWESVRRRAAYYCPTANTSTLFRRSILPEYRYPENLPVGEDYRLWVHLMRQGHRIGNLPEPLTRYRTGATYYQRRTGKAYAISDLRTKLTAVELVPWWQRPVAVAGALATVPVRMLPRRAFRVAYATFERVTRRGRQ